MTALFISPTKRCARRRSSVSNGSAGSFRDRSRSRDRSVELEECSAPTPRGRRVASPRPGLRRHSLQSLPEGEGPRRPPVGYRQDIEEVAAECGYSVSSTAPVYLDFAGAALISQQHMARAEAFLMQQLPQGNPHSSKDVREFHESVRAQVLQFFQAPSEHYTVVFTANATDAIRIVGQHFPYTKDSILAYDLESHTSILGLRQQAWEVGAAVAWYDGSSLGELSDSLEPLCAVEGGRRLDWRGANGPNLLAVTAESNFSGNRVDLSRVSGLRSGRNKWWVLLDAAKYAATGPLNLGTTPVDFLAVSFYKIFGRPTGLGALILRKEAAELLSNRSPRYFGGGSIAAACATADFVAMDADPAVRFTCGTPNSLAIAELPVAFQEVKRLHGSMSASGAHARAVAREAAHRLRALQHRDGSAVCELYGGWASSSPPEDQGPTIAFNVLDVKGERFPFAFIEKRARENRITLRAGSMCNHGACQKYLELPCTTIRTSVHHGHSCLFPMDTVRGQATGAVRASFGPVSSLRDVDVLLQFLVTFVDTTMFTELLSDQHKAGLLQDMLASGR